MFCSSRDWLLCPFSGAKVEPLSKEANLDRFYLQQEKQNVEDLQRALRAAKRRYKGALERLEEISNSVHEKRRKRIQLPPRTPGVGAEATDSTSDLPSINLGIYWLTICLFWTLTFWSILIEINLCQSSCYSERRIAHEGMFSRLLS